VPDLVKWVLGSIVGTICMIIAFAIVAFITSWVGTAVFKAKTDFNEMVRTLGLAYIWNAVEVLAVLGFVSPGLVCLVAPIMLVATILALLARLWAVKAALELGWLPTIVAVLIAWVIEILIVVFIVGALLAMLGLGVAAI
jgi:hypothetical protein